MVFKPSACPLAAAALLASVVLNVQAARAQDIAPPGSVTIVAVEAQPVPDWLAILIRPGAATGRTLAVTDLPNQCVDVTVKDVSDSQSVSYLTAGVSSKGSTYQITEDYMMYVNVFAPTLNRLVRVGIGLRAQAEVVASAKGVSLSGLLPVGIAASNNKMSGNLHFDVIGISSQSVTSAIPLPTTLSQDSAVTAIQAVAVIKNQIYAQSGAGVAGTTITPQIIGLELLPGDVQPITQPGVFKLKQDLPMVPTGGRGK